MKPARTARRVGPEVALTIVLFAAIVTAIVPLTGVIVIAQWLWSAIAVTALLLATGFGLRRLRWSALAVTGSEVAVWIVAQTVLFLAPTALWNVVPTTESVRRAWALVHNAADQIANGVAPMTPTPSLTFLLVAAISLLAVMLDHVAVTARMPLLTGVVLVAVWVISAVATPIELSVWSFVFLAAAILLMMRIEVRSRMAPSSNHGAAAPVAAVAIAVVSIVGSLMATPHLPTTVPEGIGSGGTIVDPSLNLGDDLRRPEPQLMLRMETDIPSPPYLRLSTLTEFDGETWEPDEPETSPLSDGFAAVDVDPDVTVTEHESEVELVSLTSQWLPLPYAPLSVDGLGEQWRAAESNRTVFSEDDATDGQLYTVASETVRPTLEQIEASEATLPDADDHTAATLPEGVSAEVIDLSRTVTEGQRTDYDKLIALQSWFRSTEFEYSLTAPVEEGFDGSNLAAIDRFLEVKRGYCVHYASAFALMARTLGIPTRIAVGFLPGEYPQENNVVVSDQLEIMSDQLHAWPEVYFEGIGWVGFEPTNGLGFPTDFQPEAAGGGEEEPAPAQTATASAAPTPTPTQAAPTSEATDVEAGGATLPNLLPFVGWVGGIVLVLCLPRLLGALRRRSRLSRAHRGRAGPAWRIVHDTEVDLGGVVSSAETAREFADRLVREREVPDIPLQHLVRALERSNYARAEPAHSRRLGRGGADVLTAAEPLDDDATEVRDAMMRSASTPRRILATWLPRSLWRWRWRSADDSPAGAGDDDD